MYKQHGSNRGVMAVFFSSYWAFWEAERCLLHGSWRILTQSKEDLALMDSKVLLTYSVHLSEPGAQLCMLSISSDLE